MTCEDIVAMLAPMNLPLAYHHYAEGEAPELPYLIYVLPNTNNFHADGKVYAKINALDIELYSAIKNPELEAQLEAILDENALCYEKTEDWLTSEKMYECLYEMEVIQ